MKQKTGNHAVIEQFLLDGINCMFGNPGSTEEGLIDVLKDYPDLNYYLAFHEGAAVGMASAYSKSTRKTSVVQLHTGVGLGNAVGLLYQAKTEQVPMVVIGGTAGVKYDALEAYLYADLVEIAKPVTKMAIKVEDSSSLLRTLRRAIKEASAPPAGPVFLWLPMDVLDAEITEEIVPTTIIDNKNYPNDKISETIADVLLKAQNPAFLIGDRIHFCDANEELKVVAETIGAKVFCVNTSVVNFDSSHPLYAGITGHSFGRTSKNLLQDFDVILILGTYVFPEVFPETGTVFNKNTKVIHIDNVSFDIAKNHPVDIAVDADLKMALEKLSNILKNKITDEKKAEINKKMANLKEIKENRHKAEIEDDEKLFRTDKIHAAQFAKELAKRKNNNIIYYDESITHVPIVLRYMGVGKENTAFFMRDGCLGTSLPGGVGISIANPQKTVLSFSGDGGSFFTIQALATAARYNLNTKFIIWNNESYQVLRINLMQYRMQHDIKSVEMPECFDIGNPHINFAKIAEGFGIKSLRIEKPDEIPGALDTMFSSNSPFLLDVVVFDREQNPVL